MAQGWTMDWYKGEGSFHWEMDLRVYVEVVSLFGKKAVSLYCYENCQVVVNACMFYNPLVIGSFAEWGFGCTNDKNLTSRKTFWTIVCIFVSVIRTNDFLVFSRLPVSLWLNVSVTGKDKKVDFFPLLNEKQTASTLLCHAQCKHIHVECL